MANRELRAEHRSKLKQFFSFVKPTGVSEHWREDKRAHEQTCMLLDDRAVFSSDDTSFITILYEENDHLTVSIKGPRVSEYISTKEEEHWQDKQMELIMMMAGKLVRKMFDHRVTWAENTFSK